MRHLTLFEKTLGGSSKSAGSPIRESVISCTTSPSHLILATLDGSVHLLTENYTLDKKFQAYQSRTELVSHNNEENVLITVGNDEDTISPRVKWWDLNVWDNEGFPILFNELTLETQTLASTLAVASDLQTTLVGLLDGAMTVISGHPRKLRTLRHKDVPVQPGTPITGLYICKSPAGETLYVVTPELTQSYKLHTGNIFKEKDLDTAGAELGCGVITADHKLCLGRKEGFFFYSPQARTSGHSFPGEKKLVSAFNGYVITLEDDGRKKLSVVDLKEKVVAFQHNLDAAHVVAAWDKIIVLTKDENTLHDLLMTQQIFYLTEKEVAEKIELATKKNLYELAIHIGLAANYSKDLLALIYVQHGDHLYSKEMYDEAMQQYIHTIGCPSVSSSSVIKKFLESSQNNNLTLYLEELHQAREANENHTTLLFNCFTKRKDFEKISSFLKRQELVFDYGAVIKACRAAGYFDFALQLAKRKKITEWQLKILVEDFKKFSEALSVIRSLEFEQAVFQIKKFGKILSMELPGETAKLLMDLCTDYNPIRGEDATKEKEEEPSKKQPKIRQRANAEDFVRLFTNQPKQQLKFLEFIVANQLGTKQIYNALLDSTLREATKPQQDNLQARGKAIQFLTTPDIPCDVNHALVVSNMYDFDDGTVLIYEKKELGSEVAQYYMETQQYDQVIQACKKYGKTNPVLWDQALSYFANQGPKTEEHLLTHSLILKVLEQLNLRHGSTIRIVHTLASSQESHQLGAIKNMLIRQLQTQQLSIENDYKEIKSNIDQTKKITQQIHQLQTTGKIFRNNRHLELPAVHFLSGHSYSVADIPDKTKNPATIEAYEILQAQMRSRAKAMDHSEFFRTLDRSVGQRDEDPFSHVSSYLGRGLLDKQPKRQTNELPAIDPNLFSDLGLKLI